MQAILVADYSFTPFEYWRHVSLPARQFINRCLTIDQGARMTAHEALSHPWITGEPNPQATQAGGAGAGAAEKVDLLPTVKKNFNARRTLHAAIDTIRAINQLRAGGAAAMASSGASSNTPTPPSKQAPVAVKPDGEAMEGVEQTGAGVPNHALMPHKENVDQGVGKLDVDPRGHGRGQTEEMMQEQQRRVQATSTGLWQRNRNG